MKITEIETLLLDRYLFVRIHTDAGITGLGESGTWGFLEASAQAVETFKRHLIGEDPLKIEYHWQYLFAYGHFRGAAVMGALSAVDIALWDIAGKHYGVPACHLLGGPVRDRARVYCHVKGATREELVAGCVNAKRAGFTAVGHLNPFQDEDSSTPYFKTHAKKMADAIANVASFREAVGNDVDLCIEIHRRLSPAEAIVFGNAIERFHPMFYEDPVPPENFDAMAEVAKKVNIPIATGERLINPHEFAMLVKRDAVKYLRTCTCLCGGITAVKKIAAMAEANNLEIIPHDPLSPVSLAACLQVVATIPNFAIQEFPTQENAAVEGEQSDSPVLRGLDMVVEAPRCVDGFVSVPDKPGIGIELVPDAVERFPYKPRKVQTRRHLDGGVVNQ